MRKNRRKLLKIISVTVAALVAATMLTVSAFGAEKDNAEPEETSASQSVGLRSLMPIGLNV